MHDRAIVNRLDNSVVRVIDGAPRLLRRARGYAPAPLALPEGFAAAPALLAMGGELKNTFCLVQDGRAILSQHMGDLEDAATFADYRANLALYRELLEHEPELVAVDRHPDYLSTKLGRQFAEAAGLEVVEVQHHHAHIAACLAENDVPLDAGPVLGVALDGLGYGEDGTIWGGEFLRADYRGFSARRAFPAGADAGRRPGDPRTLAQHLCPSSTGVRLGALRPRARPPASSPPGCGRGRSPPSMRCWPRA